MGFLKSAGLIFLACKFLYFAMVPLQTLQSSSSVQDSKGDKELLKSIDGQWQRSDAKELPKVQVDISNVDGGLVIEKITQPELFSSQRYKQEIEVRNSTGKTLKIAKLEPDCSCMAGFAASGPIMPGSSFALRLMFITKSDSKQFSRSIKLWMDGESEAVVLSLVGAMQSRVFVSPAAFQFSDESTVPEFEFKANDPAVDISKCTIQLNTDQCLIRNLRVEKELIRASIVPKSYNRFKSPIQVGVKVLGENEKLISSISVILNPRSTFRVAPSTLHFSKVKASGASDGSESCESTIVVSSKELKGIDLSKGAGLKLDVSVKGEDRYLIKSELVRSGVNHAVFRLTFPKERPAGRGELVVRLYTGSEQVPEEDVVSFLVDE